MGLIYESIPAEGTTATVSLPLSPTPDWFLSDLWIPQDATVVVLDDDVSIHHVWSERFALHDDVQLVHLSTPHQFDAWLRDRKPHDKIVFLIDYELLGFDTTGLDLIERHNLTENAFLVTSRTQDSDVLARSQNLKVRLLPKSSAPLLSILRPPPVEQADLVLIDDDEIVRSAWDFLGRSTGLRVCSFSTLDAFYRVERSIRRHIPIYVDMFLGDGVRGDVESERIRALGFEKIYLATGEEPDNITVPPWIDGVAGKEGPFNK